MRINEVKNIEDVEDYFSNYGWKIRFSSKIKISSIKDIRKYLFEDKYPTYRNRGGDHCGSGRSRSFFDFLLISKTYFPEKTVKEILKELIKLDTADNKYLNFMFCSNINRHNSCGFISHNYSCISRCLTVPIEFKFAKRFSINELIK